MTTRFGDFALDDATRRLLRAGAEIHLSPKAFDLLSLLIQNRDRAMSKADLQNVLWPSTFVLETNLAGLVAEIRRALDDSADDPRFIRTVARFGYWFIGAVAGETAPATPADGTKYWLVWDRRQVALVDGENIVGRAPDVHVWIDAPGVSRRHACIHLDGGGGATVKDLGSKNGTYVAGQRVTSALPIANGDQIRLGSVVMTFRVPPPADSTESLRSDR